MQDTIAPILFAITTAACFGGQLVLTNKSLAYVDPQSSSMISIGTSVVIFWFMAPFLLKAEYFTNPAMWIFFSNGLIHPLFSTYLAFEAAKRMGPTVSATITATAPLFATAFAVMFIGEQISFVIFMGILCTVFGIMTLSWKRQGHITWAPSALFFPIGAAAIRGANHNIGKLGLLHLPSPYFACLVSFTVSFVGSVLIYRYRIGRLPLRLPRQSLVLSGTAGICISVGILCMYSALNYGRVVVVSPIVSTFPLFTLLISLLFRQERFRLRILIGMILVVGGVIWISLR